MSQTVTQRIIHARIATENGTEADGFLEVLRDGKIGAFGPMASLPATPEPAEIVDAKGSWLLPGFIDVHVHGGWGGDFMDASEESLAKITRFHASRGTTTMLATTMTASREDITRALQAVQAFRAKGMPFARLAGVHLEGPFINPKLAGAQDPKLMLPPQSEWLEEWTSAYPGLIRLLTLAPELEGAAPFIRMLAGHGIVAACGHTDAAYDQIQEAVSHGLSHAVHTFNAMKGLHHREPGVVGAVLTNEAVTAEVIADGIHVHEACVRLLTVTKRQGNLVLVTDAISAAGLGDGDYMLGGQDVVVKDGVARLKEGGNLAGSTLTMIDALRYMVERIGLSVEEASLLASRNPARVLGLSEHTGSIAGGKAADLLLVSPSLEIERVWVDGRRVC
ncbi:N-acetylglucosamine-6-phosphate deacetylase [Paenibacillus mucilaginosus]|uniref:N-acetylglucosamine-6-phosphate deacetylase n=1 Tax=Paenibacillus mucilaginosus TaxID=61624 RepID=UPI00240DAE9E|nr:N-acetylglucosamine-6-phosphate deacetylase [Paenibacillus mucilaginosus]WFA17144.1 N-acetylglucosamine-6-phosphate deacetylase [Paenibacillus mucilaginosus]